MGCCQDKDLQNGQKATRSQSEDGEEEGAKEKAAGGMSLGGPAAREWGGGVRWHEAQGFLFAGDEAKTGARDDRVQRSNDSIMITVLWRRLSMFSRRGSRRQSMLKQGSQGTQGTLGRELEPEGIPEETSSSEKG